VTKPPHLDAVVIPCRDINRQRAFYERILEGASTSAMSAWHCARAATRCFRARDSRG
jgi:hypothetical protein